jgi:murein L,D-transpeptidase YafK
MRKLFAVLVAVAALGFFCVRVTGLVNAQISVKDDGKVDFQMLNGQQRIARARAAREKIIAQKFRDAGLPYPAREIFLRWLKREAELELWAREEQGKFVLVATYPILKTSGIAGPKRREGDMQVPEGFYEINRFNPESLFHLSLGLNYPNASDRILSSKERPGGDIFIHGKDVSVGCAPLGDDAIEEVYLAALDAKYRGQKRFSVHIFPARMQGEEWKALVAEHTVRDESLAGFWAQLQAGYEAFEKTKTVPEISVARDGAYKVTFGQ